MAKKRSDLLLSKSVKRIRDAGIDRAKFFDLIPKELRQLATATSDLARISTINSVLRSRRAAKERGVTFKDWKESIKKDDLSKVAKAQAQTAYNTTLSQVYNSGVYQAALENGDTPYIRYRAILDDRVRPTHEARNNIVKRADSSYWLTNTPPLDYNCRCTIEGITKGRAKQLASAEGRAGLSTSSREIKRKENESRQIQNQINKDTGKKGFTRKDFKKEQNENFKNNPKKALNSIVKQLDKQIDNLPSGLKRPYRESVRLSSKQAEVWFERFKNNFTKE